MVPQNSSSFLRALWSFLGLYASPSGLSYWWNSGSTLGLFMVVQMLSGWLLTLVYVPHPAQAFNSVDYINREVSGGAVLHIIHLAGASLFFAILFIHVARGLMAGSFVTPGLWFSGVGLLGVAMLTAFLGYTLPWGQMSFWGATVITSLVSTLPIVGWKLVIWLWGGFSVGSSALLLFYTAHYTVPMIMACLVVVHLMLLHQGGSHTQLSGLGSGGFVPFTPYFVWKDSTSLSVMALLYGVSLCNPWVFADVENWLEADPLTSPVHIQPEWYFLFAYAILRAVPSKLGGVLALLASVLILAVMPFIVPQTPKSDQVVLFFGGCLMVTWGLLTWLGGCPVESPFLVISQIMSVLYFVELVVISMF